MLYLLPNQTESKPSRRDKSARKVAEPVLSFVEGTQRIRKGYAKFFCGILNVFALICTKEKHSEN